MNLINPKFCDLCHEQIEKGLRCDKCVKNPLQSTIAYYGKKSHPINIEELELNHENENTEE